MVRRYAFRFGLVVSALVWVGSASAAEWGTLKGKFVFDGKCPEPEKITPNKDPQVCAMHKLFDESVLVDKEGGLANVVFYVRPEKNKKLEIHPDYAKDATAEVVLDNKNCRFHPHIGTLRTTQKLILKNSDAVGHNTNVGFVDNTAFNLLIPAGQSVEAGPITKNEKLPVGVSCNIHPWMTSHLVVREDPYVVVSTADGSFEMKNIPVGEYEFVLWHEKPAYLNDVKFGGEVTKKGKVTIKVKPGVTDFGKISVPFTSIFKPPKKAAGAP